MLISGVSSATYNPCEWPELENCLFTNLINDCSSKSRHARFWSTATRNMTCIIIGNNDHNNHPFQVETKVLNKSIAFKNSLRSAFAIVTAKVIGVNTLNCFAGLGCSSFAEIQTRILSIIFAFPTFRVLAHVQ